MSVFTYRMLALRFPEACDQIIDTGSAPESWTFDPEREMYCLEGETWPVMTLGLIEARRDTRTCCRCNTLEKKPLAPTRLPSTRGITLDAWAPEGVRVSAGRRHVTFTSADPAGRRSRRWSMASSRKAQRGDQ